MEDDERGVNTTRRVPETRQGVPVVHVRMGRRTHVHKGDGHYGGTLSVPSERVEEVQTQVYTRRGIPGGTVRITLL